MEAIIIENQGQNPKFERQPIAFGLNAIMANFAMDESIPTDPFETKVTEIENVSDFFRKNHFQQNECLRISVF